MRAGLPKISPKPRGNRQSNGYLLDEVSTVAGRQRLLMRAALCRRRMSRMQAAAFSDAEGVGTRVFGRANTQ
jgi:hypothetical protein